MTLYSFYSLDNSHKMEILLQNYVIIIWYTLPEVTHVIQPCASQAIQTGPQNYLRAEVKPNFRYMSWPIAFFKVIISVLKMALPNWAGAAAIFCLKLLCLPNIANISPEPPPFFQDSLIDRYHSKLSAKIEMDFLRNTVVELISGSTTTSAGTCPWVIVRMRCSCHSLDKPIQIL